MMALSGVHFTGRSNTENYDDMKRLSQSEHAIVPEIATV